jgi:hypothetical protein
MSLALWAAHRRGTYVWIVISVPAGFVEESVYRGYLQMQFAGFGMPVALAILAQAVIFAARGTPTTDGRRQSRSHFLPSSRESWQPGIAAYAQT